MTSTPSPLAGDTLDQPVPDATGRRRLIVNPITVLAAITLWVILLGLITGWPW